ncbi:Hypothetical Protein FCC1311_058082 [Hondaea fermentalgiana]|uniref:Uncharacterized protein n=1 Tax=Hondaea fermentalgiana TaxID=2315210 RepID=A0A2R5GFC3_9STRA|nr:Hypothetical Protein FCC1311_058082 [Hondaea fermentalgiana]|eukprot:GBG29587.1 Hypothetical Protein FCC1311_058082 [Hondaea fermentalgiana]
MSSDDIFTFVAEAEDEAIETGAPRHNTSATIEIEFKGNRRTFFFVQCVSGSLRLRRGFQDLLVATNTVNSDGAESLRERSYEFSDELKGAFATASADLYACIKPYFRAREGWRSPIEMYRTCLDNDLFIPAFAVFVAMYIRSQNAAGYRTGLMMEDDRTRWDAATERLFSVMHHEFGALSDDLVKRFFSNNTRA